MIDADLHEQELQREAGLLSKATAFLCEADATMLRRLMLLEPKLDLTLWRAPALILLKRARDCHAEGLARADAALQALEMAIKGRGEADE
jgi:hypothetical protein